MFLEKHAIDGTIFPLATECVFEAWDLIFSYDRNFFFSGEGDFGDVIMFKALSVKLPVTSQAACAGKFTRQLALVRGNVERRSGPTIAHPTLTLRTGEGSVPGSSSGASRDHSPTSGVHVSSTPSLEVKWPFRDRTCSDRGTSHSHRLEGFVSVSGPTECVTRFMLIFEL